MVAKDCLRTSANVINAPKPTTGLGYHPTWLNQILAFVRANVIIPGPGYRLRRTAGGMVLDIESRGGSAAATGGTQYHLKTVQSDYITCRTWDGSSDGATDIHIAKPYKWRNSIASDLLQGITHTYTYTSNVDGLGVDNVSRINSWSSTSETEMMFPVWVFNEIIHAVPMNHTGVTVSGKELKLLMVSSPRQWGKV